MSREALYSHRLDCEMPCFSLQYYQHHTCVDCLCGENRQRTPTHECVVAGVRYSDSSPWLLLCSQSMLFCHLTQMLVVVVVSFPIVVLARVDADQCMPRQASIGICIGGLVVCVGLVRFQRTASAFRLAYPPSTRQPAKRDSRTI